MPTISKRLLEYERRGRGRGSPRAPVANFSDVALLVEDLGTDSDVWGIWSTRYGVRPTGAVVAAWDDARCGTEHGRTFPGETLLSTSYTLLNNATAGTLKVWMQLGRDDFATVQAAGGAFGALAFFKNHLAANDRFHCYIGAGLSNYGWFDPSWVPGDIVEVTMVYDGSLATNADRLKIYTKLFNIETQTWSSLQQETLTFVGTIPASFSTTTAFQVNQFEGTNYRGSSIYDEIRVWASALSQAQVDAETLSTNVVIPQLRYSFNGTYTNTGSAAGHTLAEVAVGPVFCSDDLRYPHPLLSYGALRPTWNNGFGRVDFDDTAMNMRLMTPAHSILAGAFACDVITSTPVHDASGDVLFDWARYSGGWLTEFAAYTPSADQLRVGIAGDTIAVTASILNLSGTRVYHTRRATNASTVRRGIVDAALLERGLVTARLPEDALFDTSFGTQASDTPSLAAFCQIGPATEAASTFQLAQFQTPTNFTIGANRLDFGEFGGHYKGIVVYRNATAEKRARVNSWAEDTLGASLVDDVLDSYTRANSTTVLGLADTGHEWSVPLGTAGIISNQAYFSAAGPAGAGGVAVVESGRAVGWIECTIPVFSKYSVPDSNGGGAFLVVSYVDNNNYLVFGGSDWFTQMVVVVNGLPRVLHLTSTAIPDGARLRVYRNGPLVEGWINDTLIRQRIDVIEGMTATRHGIGGSNFNLALNRFDDFAVHA